MNIDIKDVAVFGDSPNDVSMFEVAGISVAVDNAVGEVKALATHKTAANYEDGVALALDDLFGKI